MDSSLDFGRDENDVQTVRGQELRLSGQKEPRLLSLIERSGEFILGVLANPDAVVSCPVPQLSIPINSHFQIVRQAEEALLIDLPLKTCIKIRVRGEKAPELVLELQDNERSRSFFSQVKRAKQQVESKARKSKRWIPLYRLR
ncbi:hypothetical protein J4Q44_G00316520 [Coregonus suidteri]|uniref:Inositol polyphosphate 5-phosphatase clathrin binding domain-containing protein n=1 Tax=Coregonus suidteri TaxID=861788 RepID=A0AAN8QR15_9TELE